MTKEKTLSEQLCELCGIKPKYKCRNVPCLNFIGNTGFCNISEKRCNPSECKNEYEPDTTHKFWKKGEAYYPNFENPENFVKLLELEIRLPWYNEPSILAYFLNYYCFNLGSRRNFLNDVIDFISDKDECYPVEEINTIKQSIRDYDGWVWG